MRRVALLSVLSVAAFAPLLAGCDAIGVQAPGGVSAGEAEALDDAAEMLDERRLPPEAFPPEAQVPPAPAPGSAESIGDAAR